MRFYAIDYVLLSVHVEDINADVFTDLNLARRVVDMLRGIGLWWWWVGYMNVKNVRNGIIKVFVDHVY